jgi:hypothetical protein
VPPRYTLTSILESLKVRFFAAWAGRPSGLAGCDLVTVSRRIALKLLLMAFFVCLLVLFGQVTHEFVYQMF